MFNLLKSDCYRLVYGKMLWVVLAIFLAMTAFTAAIVNFAANHVPATAQVVVEGSAGGASSSSLPDESDLTDEELAAANDAAAATLSAVDEDDVEMGAELAADTSETFTDVNLGKRQITSLTTLYGQSFAGGGELTMMVALLVALFFAADFDTHFVRNLVMDAAGRRRYYGEKLLLAALLSAAFLLVGMVATPLCFAVAGFTFTFSESTGAVALYALLTWLTLTMYAWMTAVVVWATHSKAAGIVMALVVAIGAAGGALFTAASVFGWKWPWLGELVHWVPYSNLTLLGNGVGWFDLPYGAGLAANGTMSVPEGAIGGLTGVVHGFIVAALWLAACAALTFAVLRKKDV